MIGSALRQAAYRNLVRSLLVVMTFGFATAVPPRAWAEPGLLSRTDYSAVPAGSSTYSYWFEQAKSPDRITYVPDPTGKRGVVQRVVLMPGDNKVASSSLTAERAEVLRPSDLGGFVDGQKIIVSWSTYIDSTFASPSGRHNNFVQTHVAGGGMSSPWQMHLVGDEAELKMRLLGGVRWSPSQQTPGYAEEWFELGPLAKNKWHDFVAVIRYGCTGHGLATVWLDGAKVVEAQERKIGYCGDPGLYWKQGFYRSAYSKPTQLWFGDTLRWATASEAFSHYGWNRQTRS